MTHALIVGQRFLTLILQQDSEFDSTVDVTSLKNKEKEN